MADRRQPPPGPEPGQQPGGAAGAAGDSADTPSDTSSAAGWSGRGGGDFARLGDLLPEQTQAAARGARGARGAAPGRAAAPEGPQGADDLGRRLATVWSDAVGPEVAANARPAQLRDGRLVVSTSSSAWAQTLQLMSPLVIAGLNERLGGEVVKKAVFRHAGWDPFAPGGPEAAPAEGVSGAGGAGAARADGSPLTPAGTSTEHGPPAGARSPTPARGGRGGRRAAQPPGWSVPVPPPAPALETPVSNSPPVAEPPPASAAPRSQPAPAPRPAAARAPSPAAGQPAAQAPVAGLTTDEQGALAELDRQPLDPALKARIREAMLAGFVRARQDSGRS